MAVPSCQDNSIAVAGLDGSPGESEEHINANFYSVGKIGNRQHHRIKELSYMTDTGGIFPINVNCMLIS